MSMDKLFVKSKPAVAVRGVHLDLKGCPPTIERLLSLLKVIAAARYNAVLVEWEDMFPWTVDERFRCETAYSPDEVAQFHAEAKRLGIEVISLVQCLGHMQNALNWNGYEALREVPGAPDVLNALAPGARELVEKMVEDVLSRTPGVRYFHLGGDEAWSFGTHPDTKAYIEKHGKGALYLHHVGPILDKLNARGIRPILWHDMMREWDDESIKHLAKRADLMVWGYKGHPDTTQSVHKTEHSERFHKLGVSLWGAGAYKGADGHDVDLPNLQERQINALGWIEVAQRFNMKGMVTTAWSRYTTHAVQCEPIDAALDSLVDSGVIFHDGQAPAGGFEACVSALESIGERQRFEAARDAMKALTSARRAGWTAIQGLRQRIVMVTIDGRRRSDAVSKGLASLQKVIDGLPAIEQQVKAALKGLMQDLWVERYLAERTEPLREEYALVSTRVRQMTMGI